MSPSSTNQPKSTNLEQLLHDTQDAYAQLLKAMERALAVDIETAPDMADARNHQVEQFMVEADQKIESLRRRIHPWSRQRQNYPAPLAEQVDQFLDILEKSLLGIQSQITHRIGNLEERKHALQQAMRTLNQQRNAHKGYLSPSAQSRYIEKKA